MKRRRFLKLLAAVPVVGPALVSALSREEEVAPLEQWRRDHPGPETVDGPEFYTWQGSMEPRSVRCSRTFDPGDGLLWVEAPMPRLRRGDILVFPRTYDGDSYSELIVENDHFAYIDDRGVLDHKGEKLTITKTEIAIQVLDMTRTRIKPKKFGLLICNAENFC